MLGIERKITGGDQQLQGSIRLTLPPAGRLGFLVTRLARFAQQYPGIDLELTSSFDTADLSRREADIAVRVMPANVHPPEYLIGRHLAQVTASAYVHKSLLNPAAPDDVSHLTWIGKRSVDQRRVAGPRPITPGCLFGKRWISTCWGCGAQQDGHGIHAPVSWRITTAILCGARRRGGPSIGHVGAGPTRTYA